MQFMAKDILANPNTSKKARFMIPKIMEEALSELEEAPPEFIEESFRQTTALMHWVATGQIVSSIDMPKFFWEFMTEKFPELSNSTLPELEAGAKSE